MSLAEILTTRPSNYVTPSVFTLVLEIFLNCYRDEEMSSYCKNITRA